MTKKDFICLGQYLRNTVNSCEPFTERQLAHLADFCHEQNHRFDRERWLGYIKGINGPSGGQRGKR